MDRDKKGMVVEDMKSRLARARATFLIGYQGIDVETLNSIRNEFKRVNTEFRVVKNRLFRLASRDTETACIEGYFVGPCAVAVTYDDIVAPAKVLIDQGKKVEHLKIKVGQISGRVIDAEGIKRLAELPSREVLLSQVLAAMQAVPTSLVRAMNGIVLNLLYVLKSIEAQHTENKSE